MNQRERFEACFSCYHDEACDQYGGIDCTNPKGIAEDAWQEAERQMIERCADECNAINMYAKIAEGRPASADECITVIRALSHRQTEP